MDLILVALFAFTSGHFFGRAKERRNCEKVLSRKLVEARGGSYRRGYDQGYAKGYDTAFKEVAQVKI